MCKFISYLILIVLVAIPLSGCKKEKKPESILQWSNSQSSTTDNKI